MDVVDLPLEQIIPYARHPRALNSRQKLHLPAADIHHAAAGERLADRGA